MAEKRKPTILPEQMPRFSHPRWLAGFLEAGGSMKLTIVRNHQNGHETPQARPEIAYGDDDVNRITRLGTLWGSTDKVRTARSTSYAVVRGDRAVYMANSIAPDALSRRTIITAFMDWFRADFTEDRVAIAERVVGRRTVDPVQPKEYLGLAQDPDFVAGVIDCRARVAPGEQPDRKGISYWLSHVVKVNSVNGPLLEALKAQHGGQFVQIGKMGETVPIRGKQVTLKNDAFEWILGAANAKNLITWANPKLPISNEK